MNVKVLIFYVLLILLLANKAGACSCSKGARLVKDEVKRSTLVMVAKVISLEEINIEVEDSSFVAKPSQNTYFYKVTFRVSTLFKGTKKGQKVVVYTGLGKGDCGFLFVVGKRYILYGNKSASPFWRNQEASPKGMDEAYWTDICTRTQRFNLKENLALKSLRRTEKSK
jgi:hypothetical protein